MLTLGMEVGHVNQANNMFLFPGIKMGTLLSGAHLISDGMSQAVSECLASYITEEEIQSAILYPPMRSIQDITAEVGAAVVRAAVAEELAEGCCDMGPRELRRRQWNMSNATCGIQFTALLSMGNKVPIICVCARAKDIFLQTLSQRSAAIQIIHDVTVVLKPRVVIWVKQHRTGDRRVIEVEK